MNLARNYTYSVPRNIPVFLYTEKHSGTFTDVWAITAVTCVKKFVALATLKIMIIAFSMVLQK